MKAAYQSLAAAADRAADQDRDDDVHRNAPAPSTACLYGLVGDVARAGSESTEANPHAVALSALVYLGCLVGRGPYLPVGNTFHHARLFALHVGRTGRGRKGDAVSLIRRIDRHLCERHPGLAPQVHTGGLSSREGLAFLIHDGFQEGKREVPAVEDKRLVVIEPEFANVLHQGRRDGNTLSAALRDVWDGNAIKPATKTARLWASHPHIAMLAAITPGELLSLIESRDLSNGFANRFLTIRAERTKLLPFPGATPDDDVSALADRFADVARFAGADRYAERDCMRMSLAPTAAKLYADLYRTELNRYPDGPIIGALLERRAPVLLRIAMVFALCDMTAVIERPHIEAAHAWVRYWAESVRFVFRSASQEKEQAEVSESARRIVEFLRTHGRASRTQLKRECFQGHLSAAKLDEAIEELLQESPPAVVIEVQPRADGPGVGTKFYRLAAHCAQRAQRVVTVEDSRDDEPCAPSATSALSAPAPAADAPSLRTVRTVRNVSDKSQPRVSIDVAHIAQSAHGSDDEVTV